MSRQWIRVCERKHVVRIYLSQRLQLNSRVGLREHEEEFEEAESEV